MGAHKYMCRCMYVGVSIGACNVGVNRCVQVYSVMYRCAQVHFGIVQVCVQECSVPLFSQYPHSPPALVRCHLRLAVT